MPFKVSLTTPLLCLLHYDRDLRLPLTSSFIFPGFPTPTPPPFSLPLPGKFLPNSTTLLLLIASQGLPHGNDSSPRVSSTPNSLLSRSQDVLEKSSSLFQVSPLESPPAQKYWNRRPKATSDGKLADPYRLTRPTRTGIGRKTARDGEW